MRVSLSEAGTLTLWTQGQTNTTLTYHGTGETGNKDYANISYLGVDKNNDAIPLSLFESDSRWLGDANGILSIHISNATLDHHFIVRVETAGFYELFLNFLVAGAADEDSDGFGDGRDNCPASPNPAQRNTDGDERGNVCDDDDDNDGVSDEEEAEGCALVADCDNDTISDALDNCVLVSSSNRTDTDGDGMGNICDADDDNDNVSDEEEAAGCQFLADCDSDTISDALDNCPAAPNANQQDTDGDGIGDACDPTQDNDADGVVDGEDNCPMQANAGQEDFDEDMIGDACDPDDDNDRVADEDEAAARCILDADCDDDGTNDDTDAFPLDATESADFDGDMIGDNADSDDDDDNVPDREEVAARCILDPDCDDDGTNDDTDAFPLDATESADFDGDRIGDNADSDDDNDTVPDEEEAAVRCILDPDCDDDGTNDGSDAFPLNATESADFDGDRIGDNADSDDDNDRVADEEEAAARCILDPDCDDDGTNDGSDAFPLDATESADFDGDRIGDNADSDDDNDNVPDTEEAETRCILDPDCDDDGTNDDTDAFPLNPTESADFDGDRIGDNADSDDDNDDVPDEAELETRCILDPDCDDDNVDDGPDLDEDGDGLIEIRTADMLHNVRYVLNGTGYKESAAAPINQLGCGNQADNECIGYELGANISLAAYADYESGKGWLPIGHDTEPGASFDCGAQGFNATFEGNDRTVSNLTIARDGEKCIGLFGHTASAAHIRNLRLEAHSVSGRINVGGMIGFGAGANISHSSVVVDSISGEDAGGLIGYGTGTVSISYSYSVAESIRGEGGTGGLIGLGGRKSTVSISHSYSVADSIDGGGGTGGLIGRQATESTVSLSHSYSVADSIRDESNSGGLIGSSPGTVSISYSYSVADSISGENVRGLVRANGIIISSYWDNTTVTGLPTLFPDSPRTTSALQSPTTNSGIYADWEEGGCNWDFGGSSDYPALLCLPASPELQRSFYMVEDGSVLIRFQEALLSITGSAN